MLISYNIPSRGLSGKELVESDVLWNGLEFLIKDETEWPEPPEPTEPTVKNPPHVIHSLINNVLTTAPDLNQIIDCRHYSNFNKLLRVTFSICLAVL